MATTKEVIETFTKAMDALLEERQDEKREALAIKAHLADLQKIIFDFGWVELQRGAPIKLVDEEEVM